MNTGTPPWDTNNNIFQVFYFIKLANSYVNHDFTIYHEIFIWGGRLHKSVWIPCIGNLFRNRKFTNAHQILIMYIPPKFSRGKVNLFKSRLIFKHRPLNTKISWIWTSRQCNNWQVVFGFWIRNKKYSLARMYEVPNGSLGVQQTLLIADYTRHTLTTGGLQVFNFRMLYFKEKCIHEIARHFLFFRVTD
jgi:hypothetical protein